MMEKKKERLIERDKSTEGNWFLYFEGLGRFQIWAMVG